MALSGSMQSSGYEGRCLQLNWTATQSINDNTSTISWTLKGAGGNSAYYYMAGAFKVVINGKTVYQTGTNDRIQLLVGTQVASGKTTVSHNSDGKKDFAIHIEAGIYTYAVNCSGDKTFTLDQIPRASTLSADTFTMGSSGTITVTKAVSTFTHTIEWGWGDTTDSGIASGKGYKGTICTKDSGTSYTWTPSKNLANIIPNDTAGVGTLRCKTYNGDTLIGESAITFKALVPSDIVPSIGTFTGSVVGDSTVVSWNLYIKGKSQCKLTIGGASGSYGSTIKSYAIKQGDTVIASSSTGTTGVLNTSGNVTFTAEVTDSRGRKATKTVTITIQDYSAPTISSVLSQRCISDGTLNDDGSYVKILCSFTYSSVSGNNTVTATVKFRKVGDTSWSSATSFTSGNAVVIGGGNISPDYTYEVMYEVSDAFSTIPQIDIVSTSFTTMDFRKGGKGVAIGKASEKDNTFEVAFNSEFNGTVDVEGKLTGNNAEFNGSLDVGGIVTIPNSGDSSNLPTSGWIENFTSNDILATRKTFLGTAIGDRWYNIISVRHRNGASDGNKYGLLIFSPLTSDDSLIFKHQIGGEWKENRTILDSSNYKDITSFSYSTEEQWTGKYDPYGRKIYSMYLGESHPGTSTATIEISKTFTNALKDCWIDDSMSYLSIKRSDGLWEYRKINNPTSGNNSQYVIESWLYMATDGKTVTFKISFGTGRNLDKHIHPYIMYTYK